MGPSGSNGIGIVDVKTTDRLTQSDILGICVSNQAAEGETIKIVKILTLTMTQDSATGTPSTLEVIKSDGNTVNVLSEYETADKKDHIHRAKTRITSKFFTVANGAANPPDIKVTGTARIEFKTGGGGGGGGGRRRLAEHERALQSEQEPVGKFSFAINLDNTDSDDTSVNDVSAAIAQLLGVPLAAAAAFTL